MRGTYVQSIMIRLASLRHADRRFSGESEKRPAGHSGGKPVLQRQTSRRRERSDKIHFTLDLFAVCSQFCDSDKHFGQFETRNQDHLSGATVSYISPDNMWHIFIVKLIKRNSFKDLIPPHVCLICFYFCFFFASFYICWVCYQILGDILASIDGSSTSSSC